MFRFTIRDVLWFTVAVALLAWYWGDRYRMVNAARQAERRAVEAAKRVEREMAKARQ